MYPCDGGRVSGLPFPETLRWSDSDLMVDVGPVRNLSTASNRLHFTSPTTELVRWTPTGS